MSDTCKTLLSIVDFSHKVSVILTGKAEDKTMILVLCLLRFRQLTFCSGGCYCLLRDLLISACKALLKSIPLFVR